MSRHLVCWGLFPLLLSLPTGGQTPESVDARPEVEVASARNPWVLSMAQQDQIRSLGVVALCRKKACAADSDHE